MPDSAVTVGYIPTSHLDLFWLGSYKSCLARGVEVIKQYVDRCLASPEETFLIETTVFAEEFLRRCPEYKDRLSSLVSEGRVEVGAAYIDRKEHLPLGESHIRNLVIGKQWCRDVLGIDNAMATHPDLPSFVPQTPQIYARAGVKYYVTTRKLFRDGAVWRFKAPDGSSMTVLHYPGHYVYQPLDAAATPPGLDQTTRRTPLDVSASLKMFPLGTIPIAGSAGDLSGRDTFRVRYGRYLDELVADDRSRYRDIHLVYTTPSKVLVPYDDYAGLPELSGEVPSVWGIGVANGWNFFVDDRRNEATILTAEMLAALCEAQGTPWRPPGADEWQGLYYERAFFDRKDPIAVGEEFRELWKMHIFVKDHNGGGEEGALSEFQKRVRQARCREYAGEIVTTALASLTGTPLDGPARLALFNPHPYPWTGVFEVELPRDMGQEELEFVDVAGGERVSAPWQLDEVTRDGSRLYVRALPLNGLAWKTLGLRHGLSTGKGDTVGAGSRVSDSGDQVVVESGHVRLALNRQSGNLEMLQDLSRDVDWGSITVGNVYALRELGNDVRLELDEGLAPVVAKALSLEVTAVGPLFVRCRVRKELLGCTVTQWYTVWADVPQVDCRVEIGWCGERDWHVRMGLPSPAKSEDVSYGSPFFGSRWTDTMREARPRNRDEVSPEIYDEYREVQGWLHLAKHRAGVTLLTLHPAFHFGECGLEALLLRTPQSCGDPRFYWEQAGRLRYDFSMVLGEPDWRRAGAPRLGAGFLRRPVARVLGAMASGFSETPLPQSDSALTVEHDHVELSALYTTGKDHSPTARVWQSTGAETEAALSGWLVEGKDKTPVDVLGRPLGPPESSSARDALRLTPWEIASYSLPIRD